MIQYVRIALLTTAFLLPSTSFAEENKGLNISNIFKIKKATEDTHHDKPPSPFPAEKEPALVLTGAAGPKMPAVPAGEIKKEILVQAPLKGAAEKKTRPRPTTTISYNPDIPYATVFFQNGYQQNLETVQVELLKKTAEDLKSGYYTGKIRIQSFSDQGHQIAMDRAQKTRKILLDHGIPMTSIEVQALPGIKERNLIHLFLLGNT